MGDSTGAVLPRDTVRVASATGLALSDLALGAVGASAVWMPTPFDTAYMTPFGIVQEGTELELYYEVSGARLGVQVRPRDRRLPTEGRSGGTERRPVVRLGFEESAADSVIRARRTLQLKRLKPGRYLVEVRVAGPGGESDMRRREIRVLKPRR